MSEVAQDTTITTDQVVAEKSDADVIFANDEKQNDSKAEIKQDENKTEAEGKQLPEETSKPTEEASSQEAASAELKLELKEGLTEGDLNDVLSFAKENNISQSAAQKILDSKLEAKVKFEQEKKQNLQNAIEVWKQETKNDPEIGGDNFESALKLADLTVSHYDKDFKSLLDTTGLGSHPLLLRFLYRIGKDLQNDNMVKRPLNGAPETRNDYDLFY